jgi:ribosomal-protein-alanine N-acetyltransferase
LGVKYHRKGIMTEALAKVIDFAFNELKLRKINICHESLNKASEGLIRKAGFKLEGCQIKQGKIKSTGKIYDRCIYGMLKSEWARNKKRLLKK